MDDAMRNRSARLCHGAQSSYGGAKGRKWLAGLAYFLALSVGLFQIALVLHLLPQGASF